MAAVDAVLGPREAEVIRLIIKSTIDAGGGRHIVAAVASAIARTLLQPGLPSWSPEGADRLSCMAPVLQAHERGQLVEQEEKLRRNVAAHLPLGMDNKPVSAMTPVELRRAQRGRGKDVLNFPGAQETTREASRGLRSFGPDGIPGYRWDDSCGHQGINGVSRGFS